MATALIRPPVLAPYFALAAAVHAAGIASRFDTLAEKLPASAVAALLVAQFPVLLLTGYFESRLDYGESSGASALPKWMKLSSRPAKLALTFGMIFVVLVPLQTWNVSIGPLDPTPPKTFPESQRAMWFAMFTAGMFFPFYLAAMSGLVPVLRVVVYPLRWFTPVLAALLALAVGFALGVLVLALTTSQEVGTFIRDIANQYKSNPAIAIIVSIVTLIAPPIVGLVREKLAAKP